MLFCVADVDGGADPPLQAVHAGVPGAPGDHVHGHRGPQGGVRRLPRQRRGLQALQVAWSTIQNGHQNYFYSIK